MTDAYFSLTKPKLGGADSSLKNSFRRSRLVAAEFLFPRGFFKNKLGIIGSYDTDTLGH